jgi:hypothetical protein
MSESDRPAIVLMVGDHAPSFIANLPCSGEKTDVSVKQRSVPYYLWSNTDLDEKIFENASTMTDLVPMLLKSAGMPLSPYYQLINDLHLCAPIRTSDGIYIDQNGNPVSSTENEMVQRKIQHYYFMEYNNISQGDDYLKELFMP